MAYKSIFGEEEIKPATTPKASTGYVSIFDDEEKKPDPIVTQTVNKRYVQDPTRSNVSIPFEQADAKTQYENLTYDEIKKMKSSELVDLRRRAGIDKGDSKEWYSSFMAGIGDIMTTVGSTMKWKGAEGGLIDRIGENIQEAGKITQSKYTDYEALEKLGEFDWGDMASPSFWQNKAPRLLPFIMSLIPAAMIGGSVGATAGASLGLGALVTTITGAIGATALSRPIEGMMEAGSTYDEAIAKGFSEEKAQKAANQVFIENLKQMSVLDVIQMIPLLKGIKGFKIPNSTVNKIVNIAGTGTAIVSEGFEEVLQNKIVSDALGEKFDLASPETKESFVLGTIMGGVFQGTGGIVNISQRAITNATKENLSKKNQAIFEKNFDKFMKEGETRSDSEVLALNEVAKIDQKGLQDAITKTLDEKSQELKEAGIEQQASTVLKEETAADKLAKQIKKSDPIDRLLATIEEQEIEDNEITLLKATEEDLEDIATDTKEYIEDGGEIIKKGKNNVGWIQVDSDNVLRAIEISEEYRKKGIATKAIKAKFGNENFEARDLTESGKKLLESIGILKDIGDGAYKVIQTKADKEKPVETRSINQLEKELSEKYKTKENAEEKLYEIYSEIEIAEAGERFMTDDGKFIGKSSTFPQWIPEHLRSRKLFDKVIGGLSNVGNVKYPEGNKTKQRELYNVILDELDSRLKVDTEDIRSNILKQYEQKPKRKTKKVASRSTRRTEKVRPEEKKEVVKSYAKELAEQEDMGFPMFQELSREDALIKEYIRSDFTEDIVARERFNIPKLEKISFGGSDRDVYNLGDKYVLKVAKTARGLAQNRLEGEPFAPVPKEIERGANYVVVEKAEKPNKATKELVKRLNENKSFTFGRDVRMDAVDMINKTAEQYFNEGNDDMGNIIQGFNNYEIMINDITSIRNWGTIDGDPVLVDAGTLDNRLLDEYEGVKNLEDEEFREIYYKSKEAKKKYGDIDTKAKYQELGESKKLPDIQLKKDVITKDMQGNRITLSEGDVFSVYELPKSRYLLEGKESYTVPKNQFQNIKGQSVVAEGKPFAPELEGLEESIKSAETKKKIPEGYGEKPLEQYKAELKRQMPKYENYTLPGGENYREILIQAPESPAKTLKDKEQKLNNDIKFLENDIQRLRKSLEYKFSFERDYLTKKEIRERIKTDKEKLNISTDKLVELKNSEEYQKYKDIEISNNFKSSHWDEPNVLFHLRMNERKHNGNKVSFMEEFQSDWAREGRDKGFSKNLPKGTENDIEIKFVKSNVPEGHDPKNYPGYYEAFDKRTGDFLGRGGTKPDLMERALEEINLTKGVPYNPLLKNWQVTSIKRALIEAVNTNADYFAWTNGEQQKARYDLSNEVDNIGWNKSQGWETSHKNIVVKAKKIEKSITIAIDENGIIVSAPADQGLLGKKLNEFLGKGLAEKIMEKEEGSLSGEGLNIGGEWANSLYDIQAKKIVESLTGGKVEMIDMGLGTGKETPSFEIPKYGYAISYTELTPENIERGIKIRKTGIDGDEYIITDVLGDGKFKAVPKLDLEMGTKSQIASKTETFDISQKTALQPALKLTPEIKAIIRGEAPQLKVEQKLYQTPSQGSQVLVETIQRITTEEALAQAQDFAIVRDTNIPIRAVEKITENPRAFGKYYKGTIDFIYNPDITTIPHEVGHYWFEAMLTKDQQTEVLREYKEWFIKNKPNKARPDTRNGWEEAMVQDMAKYYSKKYTKKKGKIERFWDWLIYQIKRVLNKNDFIARFTYDVRTKSIDRNVSKRKLADSLNQTGAIRTNGGIILPEETKGQAFRRKIQDINTRLDTTVRTLREGGVVIPESQDIFLAKTLLPRRIGGATEKFANEVMNPLINAMAKDGVDLDNLNLYLHAMHAPERNRKMNELRKAENDKRNRQRVNPKPYFPVDGLSGMTDAEARSVINTFKEMGIASKLEEYRISLQKISKATLLFQLKEGLLSQEEYDAIRGSYEYYVPLGRDIEDNAKGWGTGKGVNIKGKEVKRARGSQDLPVLPIVSQIFNRMNTAIIRAEKNRVALSVARLIKANPNIKTKTGKELWTIKSEKYIPRYDSFGEVEYVEPLGARSQKPNEIAFKYKGKQKYLVINDPLLVRALTEEGKSKPIPYLTRYTSLLSRLATQYNPEFIIRNFPRDISEALVNVSGIAENYLTKEQTKELKSDILKSIPKLFGAIYGYKSRKESHGAKELIDEFIKNGGEVGYFWLEDEKTLDQKFKRQWRKSAPKGFSDKMKNKMSDFMDFVGNVNSTVELVTRVAVYKALRERGMSAKQSAQIAGDITVDFNKKGEWGALISSMYMFFNAAVQGAARVFRSIKSSKKVRVMAASLFIGGFLNGIISQLWGDGDDEDYDQFIPDYKKNTRIVFADPTGKEWTVFFLPYGFGFFWAAGRSFSEVVRGKKDILESAENVTRAFVQSFLPIDVMGGWKEFVPSSVKPLVEVATNEAWYDAPIAPDQPAYQPKIPESQRYFKTASNMSKSLSTWLNSVTGGDENRSGIFDISPEFIDYLWQQYTSGAGSFIGNVMETGYGITKGDVKKERVPFVRSFAADVKKESAIKANVYYMIDEGSRRLFDQAKKDKFYKQVDWLIKNGSLSEDEQENIDKGNELKLNFLKGQYNFTLSDKISIVDALEKMSDKDVEMFYESLTPKQIKSIRTGK